MSAKLTKKYFLALPAGVSLASNVFSAHTEPAFAEVVASSVADRARQWSRIVFANANGRNCHVFGTRNEYKTWLRTIYSLQNS